MKEQGTILEIFRRIDAKAAHGVLQSEFDPSTVLAMFGLFRDVVRPLDPRFADSLIARASEDAASKLSAQAIAAQINEDTRWAAFAPNPTPQP